MNRVLTVSLAAIVFASFVGCPLLKKKAAEAEEDASTASDLDAATVSVTGIGAKNEASVLRYADETPLENEPGVIAKDGAVARNFPNNGPEVAFLPKGTAVAKIAKRFSTAVLVMFDDPADSNEKLIGWVSPSVFDAAAPPPAKTVVVPTPTATAVKKDAGGAVAVVDAGATPNRSNINTIDAGGGGKVNVADAGGGGGGAPTAPPNNGTIPPPPKGAQAVPPVNGKCYEGWTVTQSMCRKKCNADSDCDRGIKCVNKSGVKVCSSS